MVGSLVFTFYQEHHEFTSFDNSNNVPNIDNDNEPPHTRKFCLNIATRATNIYKHRKTIKIMSKAVDALNILVLKMIPLLFVMPGQQIKTRNACV